MEVGDGSGGCSGGFCVAEGEEGRTTMKAMLISFAVGLVVGVAYGLLRVKSPAPPLVALVGSLGMVRGEFPKICFSRRRKDRKFLGGLWRNIDKY